MYALQRIHGIVWGVPGLVMLLGTGIYLTAATGFVQLRLFPAAIRKFAAMMKPGRKEQSGISPFQALCTALAATVGTGNLVGVAGAICLGGPGAVFWMWVCGITGMATKYAEATLAVAYRTKSGGVYAGGPMYIIQKGMGKQFSPLAALYACFGILASFGVGNAAQTNAAVTGVNDVILQLGGHPGVWGNLLIGLAIAIFVGSAILGGARRIGQAAEKLVPVASAAYVLLCILLLISRARAVPAAFRAIIQGAFSPRAVTGGVIGTRFRALSVGCARGVFTNEAGMGTASIAHASAEVKHPAEQGLMGIMEVFLDTIVICTMTALAILSSGVSVPYGADAGGGLTTAAFTSVLGNWVSFAISAFLLCFAVATILGWGLYGARCGEFLFGAGAWKWFAGFQIIMVVFSSVMKTETAWLISETLNGLMAFPNLIAILWLTPELRRLTKEYTHTAA